MQFKAFINLCFSIIIFLNNTIYCEGFIGGTLVLTPNSLAPIEQLVVNDYVAYSHKAKPKNYRISHIHYSHVNKYIKITVAHETIYCAPNQQFYSVTRNKWIQAQNITPLEILLCWNKNIAMVATVELLEQPPSMHTLTVEQSHVYCVSPYKILAHNIEPAFTSTASVYISLAFPQIAPIVIGIQTVISGIICYFAYKKYKKTQTLAQIKEELRNSYTNSPSPKKPDDESEDDQKHPHGIYHDADYHHPNSSGQKSPCPRDGQTALDNSVPIGENSSQGRVGISKGEIVILKETSEKLHHGYVTTWKKLIKGGTKTELIRNALTKGELVTKKGKIINLLLKV